MKKSTHTPEYAALCATLKKARETAAISQRDLATRLNVAPSWVAKVEIGERRIDFVEYCWFLAACGVDPLEAAAPLVRKIVASTPSKRKHGGTAI